MSNLPDYNTTSNMLGGNKNHLLPLHVVHCNLVLIGMASCTLWWLIKLILENMVRSNPVGQL